MVSELQKVVTKEGLCKIQTVIKDGSVFGAIRSLAAWGAINIGVWLILGAEDRTFLNGLTDNPSTSMYLLLYGGLIIGLTMLFFAIIGFITHFSATIFLDGFSLFVVGAWNVVHDFVAASALSQFGYRIEKPSVIWVMFGLAQIVWGVRQISSFKRIYRLTPEALSKEEFLETKKQLGNLCSKEVNKAEGIIKASVTKNGPLGMSFLSETKQYTGKLLDNIVVMVSSSLDDFIVINLNSLSTSCFSENGSVEIEDNGTTRKLDMGSSSMIYLKEWSGVAVAAADIKRLADDKRATVELIKPYLNAKDAVLNEQAVIALMTINDPDAKQLVIDSLDSPAALVKSAAINVCKLMKIDSARDKILYYLNDPDSGVRSEAIRYLTEFQYEIGNNAIKMLEATESDAAVKKEITKALKIIKRKK